MGASYGITKLIRTQVTPPPAFPIQNKANIGLVLDGKGRWRANMCWVLTSYVTENSHATSIKI